MSNKKVFKVTFEQDGYELRAVVVASTVVGAIKALDLEECNNINCEVIGPSVDIRHDGVVCRESL